jgi:hypothetical protein
LDLRFKVSDPVRVCDLDFRRTGLGFRIQGMGLKVKG